MQAPAHRLTLQVLHLDGLPLTASLRKVFDERGGTIGRAAQNDWVLPDPSRFLSGHHATVYFEAGRYCLVDCSTNGVFVNEATEPLGQGRSATLAQGDTLYFGAFAIGVAIEGDSPARGFAPLHRATAAAATGMTGAASAGPLDPLRLLGTSTSSPAPAEAKRTPPGRETWFDARGSVASRPIAAGIGASAIVDPLAVLGVPTDPVAAKAAAMRDATGREAGAERDDAPLLSSFFRPPSAAAPVPEDWFKSGIVAAPAAVTGGEPVRAVPALPRAGTASSRASIAPSGPAAVALPASPLPTPSLPAPATPPSTPAADSLQAAVDLVLRGAGLDPARSPRGADPRQTLQTLGTVLHEAVAALRELVLQRSTMRRGLGLAATCIAARDNNPLKFSARGAAEVIDGFLFQHGPACLDAKAAIRDALRDLKAQRDEERLDMQRQLRAGLERIDPRRIERDCGDARRLRLIAGKADCWALYAARFAELKAQLQGEAEAAAQAPAPLHPPRATAGPTADSRMEACHGLA